MMIFLCKVPIRRIILHEKGGFILSCSAAYPPLGRRSDPGRGRLDFVGRKCP